MPVDAVIAGVQPAADEPLPEGRVAGVQRGVPGRVPAEQVRVLLEAVRETLLAEPLKDGRVGGVGLLDEFRGRQVILLLAPVHCDRGLRHLGFADLGLSELSVLAFCHCLASSWKMRPAFGYVMRS